MFRYIFFFCIVLTSCNNGAEQVAATYRPLFNGQDLTGWKVLNGKADFKVVDGEITGTTVSGEPNSFLVTEEEFEDFVLELEFLADSTNSGIQFRSNSRADFKNGKVHGYQMEIDPSGRKWSGGIYDEGGRGWLYPLTFNAPAQNAYKPGEWNSYKISCIGTKIQTWVNGVPAAQLDDAASSKGFIALQVHSIPATEIQGKKIRWRNIRIQTENIEYKPFTEVFTVNTLPNHLSESEKAQGFELLFNGNTTEKFRGAYKKEFPEKGWVVENGALIVQASGGSESEYGGDIVSRETYNAFELKFDFQLTPGANSGIKYFVTESEHNQGSAIGLEYQLLDDDVHPDAKAGKNGNRTLASLYDLIPKENIPAALKPVGEWNSGLIRVYPDNKVEHWLNGYCLVSYTRGSDDYWQLVKDSKYKGYENFGMAEQGSILLQDHGNEVKFRSLKIRKLH